MSQSEREREIGGICTDLRKDLESIVYSPKLAGDSCHTFRLAIPYLAFLRTRSVIDPLEVVSSAIGCTWNLWQQGAGTVA